MVAISAFKDHAYPPICKEDGVQIIICEQFADSQDRNKIKPLPVKSFQNGTDDMCMYSGLGRTHKDTYFTKRYIHWYELFGSNIRLAKDTAAEQCNYMGFTMTRIYTPTI